MKPLVYIASPYTHGDVAANVAVQIAAAHRILDLGAVPITPLLSHFLHLYRQRPYEDWLQMDLELLRTATFVLRLPGFSPGADTETARATELGIPVCHTWHQLLEHIAKSHSAQ